MFSPKDFIETAQGLLFAIVDSRLEQDKALCFLRYVNEGGVWRKKTTEAANAFLQRHHPDFLHYSDTLDANLHAVARRHIIKHHRPRHRLDQIMQSERHDAIERDVFELGRLLRRQGLDLSKVGVTGSVLAGVHNENSDIDLVCYERETFQRCRAVVREALGRGPLQPLQDKDWQESYRRRGSCSLSFEEYELHERRKFNKALVNGRKFDLTLLHLQAEGKPEAYRKIGPLALRCRIADDTLAFDYPAVYRLDHETVAEAVCFTATYAGQAEKGELVEIAGMLERDTQGRQHIVVGSSREAEGEYIKVIGG